MLRSLAGALLAPLAFLPLALYSEAPRAAAPAAAPQTFEVTVLTYPPSGSGSCYQSGPWTCAWDVPAFDVTLGTLRRVTLEPYAMAQNQPGAQRIAGSSPIEITYQAVSTQGGILEDQTVAWWRWSALVDGEQEVVASAKASMPSRTLTVPANDWGWNFLGTAWTDPAEGTFTYSGSHPLLETVSDPDYYPWTILCAFTYPLKPGEETLFNAPWVSTGPAALVDNYLSSAGASASLIVTYTYTVP